MLWNAALMLCEQFVIGRVMSGASPVSHKSKAGLGLFILAGFLFCVGLCFMMFGLYALLAQSYEAPIAAAVTGGVCMMIALVIVLGVILMFQIQRTKAARYQKEAMANIHQLFETVDEELKEKIEENPKAALALASVAGFVAAKKFF